MFDKQWFKRNQKLLLWLLNTPVISLWFRWVMCIDYKGRIDGILPNAIFWKKGKKVVGEFRTHEKYRKRLYYGFLPLWYVFHAWDMTWYPKYNLGFDSTGNLYPSAGTASPIDGHVDRQGVDEDFATIRAGSGNDTAPTATFITTRITCGSTGFSGLFRGIICWDTSAVGGGSVTAATLSLYGISKTTLEGSNSLHICASTPGSTSTLANSDYGQLGSTSFANVSSASFSTSGYNDFTLDANGRANVSTSSISKFGTRLGWDITNDTTGLSRSSSGDTTDFLVSAADETGTSQDPKLSVTYNPALLAGGIIFI